jgi:squalene/oxidosqualene cyclase-like protein
VSVEAGMAASEPGGAGVAAGASPGSAAVERALDGLLALQRDDGCWEGEMVWNTMILSQYVIVRTVVGRPIRDEATQAGIRRHFALSQRPDGSFGMHPESPGYVFFTTLAYVALRLLGVGPSDAVAAAARGWLRAQPGGVLSIPTWGKYWLSFLGLHEWSGTNPIPPELFLLPASAPVHPDRYYCHTRNIYAALAYLYGVRFRVDLGALGEALRDELYDAPYASIRFAAHRHDVARSDLHVAPGGGVRLAQEAFRASERLQRGTLRRRALDECLERILYEQRHSRYQAISPVNGLLDCLVLFHVSPDHPELGPSLDGVEAWRWQDDAEGVRFCGARSNTWDTAFAIQAILAAPRLPARAVEPLRRAYRYLVSVQQRQELPAGRGAHRDAALGGFCFSDGQHRWPVSDCTAEALCALLACHDRPGLIPAAQRIDAEGLGQAAAFILSRQNDDGGFGTYERRRGGALLERLNPTEMYGQCMTERSYLECTSSAVSALCHLGEAEPGLLPERGRQAIGRAVAFLRRSQRRDGSFAGFWGINFTYGAFHALRALRAAGLPPRDPLFASAGAWLASVQKDDGGWGEHYRGCLEDRYVAHPQSQAVMTSWALLALAEVPGADRSVIARGLAWLSRYQADPARFPDAVNGVFFGAAMLDYRLYKHYFPLWALGAAGP